MAKDAGDGGKKMKEAANSATVALNKISKQLDKATKAATTLTKQPAGDADDLETAIEDLKDLAADELKGLLKELKDAAKG